MHRQFIITMHIDAGEIEKTKRKKMKVLRSSIKRYKLTETKKDYILHRTLAHAKRWARLKFKDKISVRYIEIEFMRRQQDGAGQQLYWFITHF